MWSHPDSGYLMSPELCARIAELPNIVAIKYSVPREMYVRLTRLAGDKLIVSTASEEEWFDNIVELGWRLYLCSSPALSAPDQGRPPHARLHRSRLQGRGREGEGRSATASIRCARRSAARGRPKSRRRIRNTGRSCSVRSADRVRPPMLELTDAEKEATRAAFETCGLKLPGAAQKSSAA